MNFSTANRLPQLDFLRAVAVLLVVGNHAAVCPPETNFYLNKFTAVWNRGGWTGVDLFFVLSGFLVSGLLFNEYKKRGDVDLKRFLLRRGFKIYPAFWLLIFVTLGVTIFSGEAVWRTAFFDELLFVQNYRPPVWEHDWSLAVEEHFYIFLTFLFFVFLLFGKRRGGNSFAFVPKLFAVVAVVCLAFRVLTAAYLPFDYVRNIEPTHLRIDSLFFGVLLSYLWHFRALSENEFLRRNKFAVALVGAACFVPAFVFELNETAWLPTVGLTFLYSGGGLLMLALLKCDFGASRILHFLARVGTYSYSIYLWNLPVHFWLVKFTNLAEANWFLYAALYWSGTFLLGVGAAKIVEYPVLKLRDRIVPAKSAALETA